MRLSPKALVRAGYPQSDSLSGLLALATRICRLAAHIQSIDASSGRAPIARLPYDTRAVRSAAALIPPVLCDFLCPSADVPSPNRTRRLFPSSSRLRHVVPAHHRALFLAQRSSQHHPSHALAQSRHASTAAAASASTRSADTQVHHDANRPAHSSFAFTSTADLPWPQQPPDVAAQVACPPPSSNTRSDHWHAPWNAANTSVNGTMERVISQYNREFDQVDPASTINGLTRRRLAAFRLWDSYRRHAHKQSFPLLTRVSIANLLASAASLVTTNKANSPQYKALRFLLGRFVSAIFQDCQIVMAANTKRTLGHAELGVGLLQPISMALQARPISALKAMDEVLLRCRPDIYKFKTDSGTPNDHLSPINLTLRTIFDSINFETHRPAHPVHFADSVNSHPSFFKDSHMLSDVLHAPVPTELGSPLQESLKWFAASPHAFLLSHPAFRSSRTLYLDCLSQADDPHHVLEELSQDFDSGDPGFVQACELLLRSAILHKSSEHALELYDDLWSRGIPMSDRLIKRHIEESNGRAPSTRLEALLHRVSQGKGERASRDRVSTKLLRSVTRCWAVRNRVDRVERLLLQLKKRNDAGHDAFARLVRMELAAACGDVESLYGRLAEIHDFEARHVDECPDGKKPLDGKAYGLLITSCNRADDIDLAEFYLTEALERGIKPRTSDFNLVVDLHVRKSNVDAALAIFEQMKEFGVQPDKYTYTILIHGFALRRDPDSAAHTLRAMIAAGKIPDRLTYTALLNCFVESGLYNAAIRLFAWMQNHKDARLRPTIEVCNVILKAYVLSSLPVQKVMQFVKNVRKLGLSPNANTYALMLQSACDAGLMDIAEEVFSEAESALPSITGFAGQGASLYHFTIMIHGYLRLSDHAEAKEYFDEMQSRNISPSAVTWSVMVHSYAHSDNESNYDLACALVAELVADETKKVFRPPAWHFPATRAEMKKHYRAVEQAGFTSKLAAKHSPRFETLYTVLMVAQARRGEPEKAEQTLKTLARYTPDLSVHAMTPLLDAYRRAGDIDNALRLFDRIYEIAVESTSSKRHRVYSYNPHDIKVAKTDAPDLSTPPQRRKDASSRNMLCLPISIMIDLLSTAGRHEEVAKIWARARNDGFGFDSDNWNHLAASMARAGQLDEALSVVENVLNRDPPNAWMRQRLREQSRISGIAEIATDSELAEPARRDDEAETKEPETEEFDPLPADIELDPAVAHRSDATSPPSTPPNRRHQGRSDDDAFVDLPFDRREPAVSQEEMEPDDEVKGLDVEEDDEQGYPEPSAYYLDSKAGMSLTRELMSSTADRYSPWFAHFETMEAISNGLADMRKAHKVIGLLDKYKMAASLLDLHERKVEIVRERQKEEAERSARDLIDGRA
ncbi:uncharacterized protein MEPE_01220 [Melanopsichium pennsylvanicum]|uniref:Uncharacterized protein n=2 Tax=Melanopsichium pennsylvanicum TaxID=63383 RepID=A0AAJ5C3J6_9BASI|nr:fog: ppr repeat [Melanopsichium pennsylvanicum 4]SNX82514.1 uncharacterized protein MEPE_01220 [Melanopsichium pennsylvanicum]